MYLQRKVKQHTYFYFVSLGESMSWVSEKEISILMKTDSYCTFIGDCIANAENDGSVLPTLLKVLR